MVDAFTDEVFKGNPDGVCVLEKIFTDDVMQKIAFENNLSETAFILKQSDYYKIRWFTPLKMKSIYTAMLHCIYREQFYNIK